MRYSRFRSLVAGRLAETAGDAIAPIALVFAVLDRTGSVVAVGVVLGARSLTNLAFLLPAGALADRVPRHRVMVAANAATAIVQAGIAACVIGHVSSLVWFVLLAGCSGVTGAFSLPAAAAVVPQTVRAHQLQEANAVARFATNGGLAIGSALAGLMVAWVGPGWTLALASALYLLAAVLLAAVHVPALGTCGQSIVEDLRSGWSTFITRRWLMIVVLGFTWINAIEIGATQVLGPVIVGPTFGRPAWGAALAAQTAGMVVGALIALRLRPRRLLLFGVLCMFGTVAPMLALALPTNLATLLAMFFVGGMFFEQFGIAWETTMQQHVPAAQLARLSAFDAVGSYLAIPLGEVAAGPVAQAAGARNSAGGAAVAVALTVGLMLASGSIRTLMSTEERNGVRQLSGGQLGDEAPHKEDG